MVETSIFWGCTISNTLPYLIKTTSEVLDRIGVNAGEIEGWTCCPDPVSAKAYSHDASLALSARNMALAGDGMIVACSGCYNTFEKARRELEYPEARERINALLDDDKQYRERAGVEHLMETLYDNLKLIENRIMRPLTSLKVAVHYGCHALWPQAVKSDHPDNPTSLDELVEALGAESVPYPTRMDCCGVPIAAFNTEEADRLLKNKLANAKAHADCIVTPCPTCFLQFDRLSKEMKADAVPVFYVTELIGLAMDLSPEDMALDMHATSVQPVLDKLGLQLEQEKDLEEVKKYFDYLDLVSHCEACRLECTEAVITKDDETPFDPLDIVDLLKEGRLDDALESPMVWRCLQCGKCLSRCPNNIGLKDIFMTLREIAVERGNAPPAIDMKIRMIEDTGYGVRLNEMIRRRLGMEPAPEADTAEIERIIKKSGRRRDG